MLEARLREEEEEQSKRREEERLKKQEMYKEGVYRGTAGEAVKQLEACEFTDTACSCIERLICDCPTRLDGHGAARGY